MPSLTEYSEITEQVTKAGFGSYLDGILPPDIATACGAFSISVQQVKNVSQVPAQKLAQVILNLETMRGLSVNGSNVPADKTLATSAYPLVALGSGPQKTYTMSDFYGCMSGLPYNDNYKIIQQLLNNIATPLLYQIYDEMYLASSWQQATGTVILNTYSVENPPTSGNYDYYYDITGVTLTSGGGGYTRGGAPLPTATISGTSGATASLTVDTNQANTPLTYGRVTSLTLTSPGVTVLYGSGASPVPPNPGITVTITIPPDNATGGWPGMNTVVQNYINSANTEIISIATTKPTEAQELFNAWVAIGRQLKIEQRARKTGLYPLPDKDPDLPINQYPTVQYSFIDQFAQYALNTKPHMYSQTIEAISNWTTVGGQSMVGLLRELRNQARLDEIGIELDNNIPSDFDYTLNDEIDKSLISNGVIDPILFPDITDNDQRATLYVGPTTIGGSPVVVTTDGANLGLTSRPLGYYNSTTNNYILGENPFIRRVPGVPVVEDNTGKKLVIKRTPADADNLAADPSNNNQINNSTTGNTLENGTSAVAGSLAGSPFRNIIRPELNAVFASRQLTPSTYTNDEAIQEVEDCNCDCWENL